MKRPFTACQKREAGSVFVQKDRHRQSVLSDRFIS